MALVGKFFSSSSCPGCNANAQHKLSLKTCVKNWILLLHQMKRTPGQLKMATMNGALWMVPTSSTSPSDKSCGLLLLLTPSHWRVRSTYLKISWRRETQINLQLLTKKGEIWKDISCCSLRFSKVELVFASFSHVNLDSNIRENTSRMMTWWGTT